MKYAELHCISNFSFLRGASHPEELVARAKSLGYSALAITDECSLAGAVRAHVAAKQHELKLIIGSELRLSNGPDLVLLAADREGYGNLCELMTRARRAAKKGAYQLARADLASGLAGCLALLLPGVCQEPDALLESVYWLTERFCGRSWIAVELLRDAHDHARLAMLRRLSECTGVPLVAAGNVHMHVRSRRVLQDTLTAIRLACTIQQAGHALCANGEQHLRSRERLSDIYPEALLRESIHVAEQCSFSLNTIQYEYPEELVPRGETPTSWLRRLTEQGMRRRWPGGAPDKVREMLNHELDLIAELGYEPFFLTVHDLVQFARSRGILCQGRGSAANSAVCYCLGVTEVDPARMAMLFERFVSKERNEPPDIDVDFEHERREEVVQHIYRKYGRERAALAATVVTYRPRSAIRDVGKALGMELAQIDRIAKSLAWWDGREVVAERFRENGIDPESPVVKRLIVLTTMLQGFPRHLSQHVGGFVIANTKLSRLVPIENAAMPERTQVGEPAIRLGFRMVKGFSQTSAERLVAARAYTDAAELPRLASEAQLNQRDLRLLAFSGSLKEVAGNRHQARWQVLGIESSPPLLAGNTFPEGTPMLPVPSEGQALVEDYAVFGFTLGPHPLALLRHHLERMRMVDARQLQSLEHGQPVRTSGLVVNRQRPSTASGVVFITLEDETGHINLVLWPWVTQKQRAQTLSARLLGVDGVVERDGDVIHVVAKRLEDHSHLLGRLTTKSRDFH